MLADREKGHTTDGYIEEP